MTRVERLDDCPTYGEVPGTSAYELRAADAVPDQVEVVTRSRAGSLAHSGHTGRSRAFTVGGTPIPTTIVEKIDPDELSHGEVPGTPAFELHKADAQPDIVVKAPEPTSPPASATSSPKGT